MQTEWKRLRDSFEVRFQRKAERFFSAPGRTELCGNHTDHQQGKVLAAAVDLDVRAAVACNGRDGITIYSEGFAPCSISVMDLRPRESERGTTAAMVRGVAAGISRLGYSLAGFDACVSSSLPVGRGLSSSAAFEVLVGTILNSLFCGGAIPPSELAKIGQRAENDYYGKPSGLMDQMAAAHGGVLAIDFADNSAPAYERLGVDFAALGYSLCMVDSGAGHAGLTAEYAAVPGEIRKISAVFGKDCLRDLSEEDFYSSLPRLRRIAGDRAVLRAIHVFDENRRVDSALAALKRGDMENYLKTVVASGDSSWKYLQNVIPSGAVEHQEMALTLAVVKKLLKGAGACRMQGGGFAGAIQAYVPNGMLEEFGSAVEESLGEGSLCVLRLRARGGCEEYPFKEME